MQIRRRRPSRSAKRNLNHRLARHFGSRLSRSLRSESLEPRCLLSVNVLQWHNDLALTGANTAETVLTPANVSGGTFGKLFTQGVDGQIYAQPLYVSNVMIGGTAHNVVFVATQHDSVYAFDADNSAGGNASPLWRRSFTSFTDANNYVSSVPNGDTGSADIQPEIGITGTPVISANTGGATTTGTMYVDVKTKEAVNGNVTYHHRLHALNIATGLDTMASVNIAGTVPGNSSDSSGGVVTFNALRGGNRPALVLNNGVLYVSFASHGDNGPYHGWVFSYNASNLNLLTIFNTTPNGGGNGGMGGIWMASAGLAIDGNGSLYFSTGNGDFDGVTNFGDSILKLSSALVRQDFFTPSNQQALANADEDLGSGGVMLLPDSVGGGGHAHLAVQTGKEGKIYLMDRDNMGGYHPTDAVVHEVSGQLGGAWSSPAYFNGRIYYNTVGDHIKAFSISNGVISDTPVAQGTINYGYPGATPSVSANGTANGIVWTTEYAGSAVLHAYDATTLQQLYTSSAAGSRDVPGGPVKFTQPIIANGKVYIGTSAGLSAYGLLPSATINDVSQLEGNSGTSNFVFTVSLAAPSIQVITVNYATANGTGIAGTDYQAVSGTLTFNPGVVAQTISVPVIGNLAQQPNRTFVVNLTNPQGVILSRTQGVGTILDDDSIPGISVADVSHAEGPANQLTGVLFHFTLTSPTNNIVTVHYAITDGTATLANHDYQAASGQPLSGTVTFAAGVMARDVGVNFVGDNVFEPDESFNITLSNPVHAVILRGQATATILNDDAPPSISVGNISANEGNSGLTSFVVPVTLSGTSYQTISVHYATADGTASSLTDYVGGSGTLVFPAGTTTQNVTVLVRGDKQNEPNETFFVNLSSPINSSIGAGHGVATILNDDPLPRISINDVSKVEGDSGATMAVFTVKLVDAVGNSVASGQIVSVDYFTSSGTATSGSDYAAESGTVVFLPGVLSRVIIVPIYGDTNVESNETFFVNLSSPVNVSLPDTQAQGTIIDDDTVPTISINDVSRNEGNAGTTNFVFTVSLSNPYGSMVYVDYSTANGTAASGSDYVSQSGTLAIFAGTTSRTITVRVKGDTTVEPNETFQVNLSNPVNGTIGDSQGMGTILNDDSGPGPIGPAPPSVGNNTSQASASSNSAQAPSAFPAAAGGSSAAQSAAAIASWSANDVLQALTSMSPKPRGASAIASEDALFALLANDPTRKV